MAATTYSTLEEVKTWLSAQKKGGQLDVNSSLFSAQMINDLFTILTQGSLPIKIDAIDIQADSASVTGTGTLLSYEKTSTTFTFSESDSLLILELDFTLDSSVKWTLIDELKLSFTSIKGALEADTSLRVLSLSFSSIIEAGTGDAFKIPINMQVPSFDGDWILAGNFISLGNLTTDVISAIGGNNDLTSILPAQLQALEYLKLDDFQMSFNPLKQTCSLIKIVLAFEKPDGWKFFSDKFVVDHIKFDFEVINPYNGNLERSFQAGLIADMTIAGAPVQVGGHFPEQCVFVQLQPTEVLHLAEVFKSFDVPLPGGFPQIDISTLSFIFFVPDDSFDFQIGVTKAIPISGDVSLDNFYFQIQADHKNKAIEASGLLTTHFTIGPTTIVLDGNYESSGVSTIYGEVDNLEIGHIIDDLTTRFGIDSNLIPSFISDLIVKKTTVLYSTDKTFKFYCQATIEVANKELDIFVNFNLTNASDAYTIHFDGALIVDSQEFKINFDGSLSDTTLSASWKSDSKTIGIVSIAKEIGINPPPIPEGLDLDLDQINLTYSKSENEFLLEAESKNFDKASFAALKNTLSDNKWEFYFGMATGAVIELSNLPIISKVLPSSETLAIDSIKVNLASALISKELATEINALINKYTSGYPTVDAEGMKNSVSFSMELDLAGDKIPISLGANQGSSGENLPQVSSLDENSIQGTYIAASTEASQLDVSSGSVIWFNLQKNFGPLYFDKVGLTYKDSKIFILVNVSGTAGGLTLGLEGFGVEVPISSFDLSFTIDGIGITFVEGPVTINGMLQGSFSPVNLTGEVLIKVEELTIAGIGGYTTVSDQPSMFLYAILDFPIGGPAFFFVTGLSAGFGYNRKLVLPDISEANTFPFVEWVIGSGALVPNPQSNIADQVNQVVETLVEKGTVAPELGTDWLSAGIRFTSFEMVDSFALLTIIFGTDTEIAILGLSRMTIPVGAIQSKEPIVAEAELALKASYSFSSGELGIQGQLTNNSFVLSKDCRITGGFAFFSWFKGAHAGDFVISLGGYDDAYTVPDYYPSVPRLGINWIIPGGITIKGNEYFALTSNAVMAGGYLEAVWKAGDLKAWFSVQADFLIVFKPFHYDISASVDIGASFILDLLFTSVSITIHVGVGLHIWGPEFAGTATVHIAIISFTISFGASNQQTDTTIEWDAFVSQLLPSKPKDAQALLGSEPQSEVCKIVASDGLITQLSSKEGELNWVVNPEKIVITTSSIIPSKDWAFSSNVSLAPATDQPIEAQNKKFGIRPVGVDDADFESTHEITITSTEDSTFNAILGLDNVPKGLWEKIEFTSDGKPIISDPINGTTLDNVLIGFVLKPYVPPPDHTLPIKIEYLRYTIDPNYQYYSWNDPYVPTEDDFDGDTVAGTIAAAKATANRTPLIVAMNDYGLNLDPVIDIGELSSVTSNDLLAEPVMQLLGEVKS